MMRRDITGLVFERLTVKGYVGSSKGKSIWECICTCGNITRVSLDRLTSGNTRSCGCLKSENIVLDKTVHGHAKHGFSTPEYRSWQGMKYRCYNPKSKSYQDYGGRGIKVCEKWKNSFENFLKDVGLKPSKEYSLDRIDVNGDYTPENVKWSTNKEQVLNRRPSIKNQDILALKRELIEYKKIYGPLLNTQKENL